MKIQFIIHTDSEQPGAILPWTKEMGYHTAICRPFAGEALPTVRDFDWLVIMGGPQSLLESHLYPYLQDEIALIQEVLKTHKVVLGICLGAQLLGEAFGAKTEKSPHKEVGVFPIARREEDPLLEQLPGVFSVVHWHSDMPGLTPSSTVLAASEGCPRQIVRYSPQAYGLQCHLEPALEDIKEMIVNNEDDLKPGRFIQTKEELLRHDYPSINQSMHAILNNLLKNAHTKSFGDVVVKKSGVGQFKDGLGAFAAKDFNNGEVVIEWKLKSLTEEEYRNLSHYERNNFCHKREGTIYFYPDPERHVNRSIDASLCNVVPDFDRQTNIAVRNIKKGEELVMLDSISEDF